MAEFDTSSLTKEQIAMAMKCKTADELIALAKKMGVVITKEQAEATLERVAVGVKTCYMVDGCAFKCGTLKDC